MPGHHAHDSPAHQLQEEHHVVRRLVRVLEGMAGAMHDGVPVRAADAQAAVDTVRGFADRCHHAKEEDVLFPALRQALPSESQAVLRDLTHDHERGRALVGAIESYAKPACAGDARSIAGFETAVAAYARLLEQHIEREDLQLVTLADRLPPAVKTQVEEGFERVELAATGKGGHARYEHAIDDLAKRYSRYARRSAAA